MLRLPLLLSLSLFLLHLIPVYPNPVFQDVRSDATQNGTHGRAPVLMAIAGFAADVAAEEGTRETGT